ncbi:DNA polymerase III subunit alpha [Kocuria rosea]|uniref:DNA polymerase III subunit alpha n=1 Tax=Kocuria rosea TaxID=1275 RepID=UPI0020408F49|nr:DNA polymerase III subunit alpha [Kocuria rosea]MCM3688171.1 DNA polymerase III subunit alpha [Kocuria rosea]
MSFPHLHVATAFSAHYGVSRPRALAAAAAADGADVLACTDRDGLYGAVKHLGACREHGLDPVLGADLALLDPGRERVLGRVVVLAAGGTDGAGYAALCRLVSAAHASTGTRKGRGGAGGAPVGVTAADVAAHARPPARERPVLTVLLGPASDVGRELAVRRYRAGRAALARWRALLPGEALAVEVVSHLTAPGTASSTSHAARLLRAALEAGLTPVLTNAVRYATPAEAATADVLDAARALTPLEALGAGGAAAGRGRGALGPDSLQPNGQGWLKPARLMRALAAEIARAADLGDAGAAALLGGTHRVADRCRLDPVADCGWGRPVVPEAAVLGLERPAAGELRARCEAGLARRYPGPADPAVRDRLERELGVIEELGFASYFLTVAEVSAMIGALGIRHAARGSGVSSLVNYLLEVSHVDPLEHELLFERFLSSDRSTLPDIDIDVESAQRHRVYREVFARFGPERVSLMSMQNAYRARGAVRDAGLALGVDPETVDTVAKQLWNLPAAALRGTLADRPELCAVAEQVAREKQLDLLVDLTERLDRLPRHISVHPCGVILGDRTLLDRTPVQASGMGLPMSQFDKHDMDPMGMLKLDILGVRMQSALAHAVEEVARLHPDRPRLDLEAVPRDDEATFELIRSTHTLGCFQIESPGQRELIGKMAPTGFGDLIVDISLFRPGPMHSDMVRPYLEHRHGWSRPVSVHPDLDPILAETHGVTVFHEQVLRILDVFTGCGLARADELRRRLGAEGRLEVEAFFRERARERGYPLDVVDRVWGILAAFGSFGFCKAHGAAFAVPTYQSAWLKAHHPEAFLAGLWEHDPGMYPKRLLVGEARRMGIPILPVDVNRSDEQHRVERLDEDPARLGVRLALTGIHGVSRAEVRRIAAGRPYATLADLRERARPGRRTLERLAAVGALDGLLHRSGAAASRADLVHALRARADADRPPRPAVAREVEGQLALPLGDLELRGLAARRPEPTVEEKVRTELELLAVDVSAHLMDSWAPLLRELGVTPAERLLELRTRSEVLVAGVRVSTMTPPVRSGRRVVFVSLDDGTGPVDCAFFADAQERSGRHLFGARMLLVRGRTRRTGPRGISVGAVQAWDLTDPATPAAVRAALAGTPPEPAPGGGRRAGGACGSRGAARENTPSGGRAQGDFTLGESIGQEADRQYGYQ